MNEKIPQPNKTPEEIVEIKNTRTLSDAELIKRGASHSPDSDGLEVPEKLQEDLKKEHEGDFYENAAEYVRGNKTIVVPAEHVPENVKKQAGEAWVGSTDMRYVDGDGNIAQVIFDYKKIAGYDGQSYNWEKDRKRLMQELEKKGFKINATDGRGLPREISGAIEKYQQKAEDEDGGKKEKFAF